MRGPWGPLPTPLERMFECRSHALDHLSDPERRTMGAMMRARFLLLHPAWAGLALDTACCPPLSRGMSWSATNASGFGVRVPGR